MTAAFVRMRLAAKRNPGLVWNNLMHQMSKEMLSRAYHALDGKKARGMDGISKAQYGKELTANLGRLKNQLHEGSYKPKPSRRVKIPRAGGKVRPLAISNVEDKVVQKAVADILVTIYEPVFCNVSHGFRPHRGTHTAIQRLYHWLADRNHPYVVDVDIEKFFDTIDHQRLMEILRKRIADRRFLRLIWRLLSAGVLTERGVEKNTLGTPQGSIISPILANIYLHEIVDQWIRGKYAPRQCHLVRYADDMVMCFGNRQEAKACLLTLQERFAEFGLRLHPGKSRVVAFERGGGNVFHFLGFMWYWGRNRKRQPVLKLKTQTERFRKAIVAFTQWIKTNRNRKRLKVLWKEAGEKLRGHYAYYGTKLNSRLFAFYWAACNMLLKWLNRRSQKRSFSRASFQRRLARFPLPKPWGCNLLDVTQREFAYDM